MLFVDEVKIYVKAGDGGKGAASFMRAKFIPKGGPDGGDGGNGGSVIMRGDKTLNTLLDLRYQQYYTANSGSGGEGAKKQGRQGGDMIIRVPLGTVVKNNETDQIIADIDSEIDFVVAKGGRGGKGNAFFKSSTNRAPRFSQPGEEGEEFRLKLELKLLADVGIIGCPNAGKSTLISRISSAKPKIADYPFTTIVPNLGIVNVGEFKSFVAVDIPGLIEGAHLGKGLGDRFLRHVERTSVLLHLIDAFPPDERDPIADYEKINKELGEFNPLLKDKPQIVALNKIELSHDNSSLDKMVKYFKERDIEVFKISAVTGEGIKNLIYRLYEAVEADLQRRTNEDGSKED